MRKKQKITISHSVLRVTKVMNKQTKTYFL
jgi:hypothetical protein